jgi:hypothetical protein
VLERAHQIGHHALANERQRAARQIVAPACDHPTRRGGAHRDEQRAAATDADDGAADHRVEVQLAGHRPHFLGRGAALAQLVGGGAVAIAGNDFVQLA